MPVSPTGYVSGLLANARTMLANCASFQAWVGAANVNAALASIHLLEAPDPALNDEGYSDVRPLAVVMPMQWQVRRVASTTFVASHGVVLFLEADADQDLGDEDNLLTFANVVGAIFAELQELAATGDHLIVDAVTLVGESIRRSLWEGDADPLSGESDKPGDGDYFQCRIELTRE